MWSLFRNCGSYFVLNQSCPSVSFVTKSLQFQTWRVYRLSSSCSLQFACDFKLECDHVPTRSRVTTTHGFRYYLLPHSNQKAFGQENFTQIQCMSPRSLICKGSGCVHLWIRARVHVLTGVSGWRASPGLGSAWQTLVERLLARGSLAVDSRPREGGPKKKIEVRTREFQS